MTGGFQSGKIDNLIAERDPDSRGAVARFKNTKRQILQRKMRIRWDIDETSQRH